MTEVSLDWSNFFSTDQSKPIVAAEVSIHWPKLFLFRQSIILVFATFWLCSQLTTQKKFFLATYFLILGVGISFCFSLFCRVFLGNGGLAIHWGLEMGCSWVGKGESLGVGARGFLALGRVGLAFNWLVKEKSIDRANSCAVGGFGLGCFFGIKVYMVYYYMLLCDVACQGRLTAGRFGGKLWRLCLTSSRNCGRKPKNTFADGLLSESSTFMLFCRLLF